ncbi:MAG: hypothetical protein HC888_00550 [Candidatus Competibacteraceae bacterium]|nr:hypothetical protein [Candidatus Competibacteraceae bacterium]
MEIEEEMKARLPMIRWMVGKFRRSLKENPDVRIEDFMAYLHVTLWRCLKKLNQKEEHTEAYRKNYIFRALFNEGSAYFSRTELRKRIYYHAEMSDFDREAPKEHDMIHPDQMREFLVKSGWISRLTETERKTLQLISEGVDSFAIQKTMGFTKQRLSKIIKGIVKKGRDCIEDTSVLGEDFDPVLSAFSPTPRKRIHIFGRAPNKT